MTNGTSNAIRQSLDLMFRVSQQEGSIHLAELRQVLEPEIAALAALRIEDQLLTTMREAATAMDRSLQDPGAYIEADLDFHLALAEAVGNPLILSLLDSIVELVARAAEPDLQRRRRPGRGSVPSEADIAGDRGSRSGRRPRCDAGASRTGARRLVIVCARCAFQTKFLISNGAIDGETQRVRWPGSDGRQHGGPPSRKRPHCHRIQPDAIQGPEAD